MSVTVHPRPAPPLPDLANVISKALKRNFTHATAVVVPCPDLREKPFYLAAEGLAGDTRIADVGGQGNLFPSPNFDARFSLLELAGRMGMSSECGFLLGAGAAPWMHIGHNAELAPNLSWKGRDGLKADLADSQAMDVINGSRVVEVLPQTTTAGKAINCRPSPTNNCALMVNLFGSKGHPGPVLKVTARSRTGPLNFTNSIRAGLLEAYGEEKPLSMGGVFLLKRGKAKFHVMPDFPAPEDLPFTDRKKLENEWLEYQICQAPVVCLTVFHSADPEGLGLRMEHTHCFDADGGNKGGHYHYDLDDGAHGEREEVEYEAYLNAAEILYRIDRP
ncbi:PTD012 family protein [Aspergillus stella-maris]|uniref:PTD012 family protein n=1 Tax=Aspergillus stella-maris TaxID=1810926 RepID=UPI003CCDF66C